ncbi:hypothetical protein FCM35_KLT20145 [Carex littledalei]|uniref:Ycf20-like protein n=1 Tax=Carex littledalei TaxID=544730 RepID=A0A833VUF3_9POAL|nr:hypothetical protein FCM35_KLT20145 [Carex littledalei]
MEVTTTHLLAQPDWVHLSEKLQPNSLSKLNSARKKFPMKIFLLLLGFYTANALATILGQTRDWDVLVAGMVVAAIEGIGMLMYGKPVDAKMVGGRLQKLVVMVNFWKAGVCLGLFVDAFKLGS